MTTFQRRISALAFDKAATQALAGLCFSILLALCISHSTFRIPHCFPSYTYNAENNRIGITSPTETTTLVVDPEGALPKVLSRTKNGVTTRYVYGAGLQYEVSSAGAATYYHFDQTGNTAALSNQAGSIIERVAYSPYGIIRYKQSNFDTPFLYGGYFGVMVDSNGLINMRARYYNPATMRFVNSDPAMAGLNWYAYASNPISFADPSGFGAVSVLNSIQTGLAVLGFVPGIGALADVLNAGISVARGHYGEAALSLAAAVPAFGDAFAAGKIASVAIGATVAARSIRAVSAPVVTAARVERAVVSTRPLVQTEFAFARGASIQTPGVTRSGEVFVRVGATEASTTVRAGSYAIPKATFNAIGQNPAALKNALDLPGSAPQYYRYIRPPAGTSIQRGIVPGGEFGGVGGHPEVIFPKGVN